MVLLLTSRCCFLSLRFSLSLSLSLSLFLVLFLLLPCGYRCYCISLFPAVPQCSLCLADSLFASLCLLPLSGFSSLSFCLASCPSLWFSSSLSVSLASLFLPLSLSPSFSRSLFLSLSLSLSRCLPLSGLLCLSLVLVPSSLCFCLSLGYSV